jgi:hypothetical protein
VDSWLSSHRIFKATSVRVLQRAGVEEGNLMCCNSMYRIQKDRLVVLASAEDESQ